MGDFYQYDVEASVWTALSGLSSGTSPTPRSHFGIASFGTSVYVFGGWSAAGKAEQCWHYVA